MSYNIRNTLTKTSRKTIVHISMNTKLSYDHISECIPNCAKAFSLRDIKINMKYVKHKF